jgi:hypothetical protein
MQLPPQSCWPATVQPQLPFTQEEPEPQTVPHVPQSAAFVSPPHVPSGHFIPDEQVDEQIPVLSQTSPLAQAVQPVPQCWGFDWTQPPPQLTKPPVQAQEPAVQVLPLWQTLPHVPQFWLSLCRFTQVVPHCIWPGPQVPPDPPRAGGVHDDSAVAAKPLTKRRKRVLGGVSFILSLPELHGPPVPTHGHLTASASIGQALSFSGNSRAPKLTTLASSMFHWS